MSQIDDLKYIHAKDTSDALGIAEKQWQQLEHEFAIPELDYKVENIVFTGMGGSALAALLSKTWPGYTVPFEVTRGYHLPSYVSSKTLVIASSYSGNTEETISALHEAENAGAHIICISSGGKLADLAKEKGHLWVELPQAAQPRFATLYSFKAFVTVLERAGLVNHDSAEKEARMQPCVGAGDGAERQHDCVGPLYMTAPCAPARR